MQEDSVAWKRHPLVGSWRLDSDDPHDSPVLAVFGGDGTYLALNSAGASGAGAWWSTGEQSAALTVHFLRTTGDDDFEGTVAVHGKVNLDPGGRGFRLSYTVEFLGADGMTDHEGGGTARGTRIGQTEPTMARAPSDFFLTDADPGAAGGIPVDPAEMYLDLLKRCLTRLAFGERPPIAPETGRPIPFDPERRVKGTDWPSEAETMVGLQRLDNVQRCVVDVLHRRVPGDLIETGVWRGGVTILMRAILQAYGDTERSVWLADSFQGLPPPNAQHYPADAEVDLSPSAGFDLLAVSVEQVRSNFARYGLLDDRVRFLEGWFRDTLPAAPIERLAVLRLDGDLYESTSDALRALYPKLSIGGYVIVDDFGAFPGCRQAVEEYRTEHGITEPIQTVDWTAAYWRREK